DAVADAQPTRAILSKRAGASGARRDSGPGESKHARAGRPLAGTRIESRRRRNGTATKGVYGWGDAPRAIAPVRSGHVGAPDCVGQCGESRPCANDGASQGVFDPGRARSESPHDHSPTADRKASDRLPGRRMRIGPGKVGHGRTPKIWE